MGEYMKNIKKILIILMLSFALVACESNKNLEKTIYFIENKGIKSEIILYHDKDNVLKQTNNNEILYSVMDVDSKKGAEEALKYSSDEYKGVKGIEQSIEYKDDKAVETIEINYSKLDFEEARNIAGLRIDKNAEQGISLKKSIDTLEQQGFTKK